MKAELLAPAGSYEGLQAVVKAGADAVYIGGSMFGARAYANNPDVYKRQECKLGRLILWKCTGNHWRDICSGNSYWSSYSLNKQNY